MAMILESIGHRISIRSYREDKIPAAVLSELNAFIAGITEGPFGSAVRFVFLDESGRDRVERKKLGTYGMITGDRFYIAGAVEKDETAEIDYGYSLERIVLKATELGLGTCWVGGSLNRSTFADRIGLRDSEIIPAITPVGLPSDLKRLKVRLIQNLLQVRTRKDFSSLFFDRTTKKPLDKESLGSWGTVLEAVRAGPSASNKQPWRIVRENGDFDFYLDYDKAYNAAVKGFMVQKVDIGIALCHFELAANALNLGGSWNKKPSFPEFGKLMYITTWNCGMQKNS